MYHSSRLFLITAILIILNIISVIFFLRFDLTQGKIYTLSDSSTKIIAELPDGMEIIAFISQDLPPQFITSKNQLLDKLEEYDRISGGKLKITYKDPIKDPDSEALAQSFGIPPLDLQVIENDQVQIQKAYFGMAIVKNKTGEDTQSTGSALDAYEKYEVLPIVENFGSFEYDIASMVLKVGSEKLPAIGFLTGHNEHSLMPSTQYPGMNSSDPRMDYPVREFLERNYDIKVIDLASYLTSEEEEKNNPLDEVTSLIVAGPQQAIPDEEAKLINEFVKNGGNAVLLIDQYDITTQYGLIASRIYETFSNILGDLGISIRPNIIADNNAGTATFNSGFFSYSIPYPYFVKVDDLNKDNSITQDLESFILPWASPLQINDDSSGITVLGRSSEYYKLMEEKEIVSDVSAENTDGTAIDITEGDTNANPENIEENPENTPSAEPEPETKLEPINLDPQQEFNFSSQKQDPQVMAAIVEKEGQGKVVVIGDSDFVVQGGENTTFFLNIIDSLSLGNDLIQIRSKGITDRPLKNVSEAEKNTIRWGLILGIPILFILYGFYRRSIRNAKKARL